MLVSLKSNNHSLTQYNLVIKSMNSEAKLPRFEFHLRLYSTFDNFFTSLYIKMGIILAPVSSYCYEKLMYTKCLEQWLAYSKAQTNVLIITTINTEITVIDMVSTILRIMSKEAIS